MSRSSKVRQRSVMVGAAALLLAVGAPSSATALPSLPATIPPVSTEENEYLDLERSVTECISALPKPGCGREPVDSGDRGGWQQFLVFGILMTAMAGIGTRVAFAVRRRDRG